MRDVHERDAEREARGGSLRPITDPELISDLETICGAPAEPELALELLSFREGIVIMENDASMCPTSQKLMPEITWLKCDDAPFNRRASLDKRGPPASPIKACSSQEEAAHEESEEPVDEPLVTVEEETREEEDERDNLQLSSDERETVSPDTTKERIAELIFSRWAHWERACVRLLIHSLCSSLLLPEREL